MKKLKSFWIIFVLAMIVSATAVNGATKEFQFEGYTSQTTDGDAGGVAGMNALCQQEFGAKARMCTTREWWTTHQNQPAPDPLIAWVQPVIVFEYFDPDGLLRIRDWTGQGIGPPIIPVPGSVNLNGPTCSRWTNAVGTNFATTIDLAITHGVSWSICSEEHKVTCCK